MEFKSLVNKEIDDQIVKRVIYYNAFTEDLFSWDNDLLNDLDRTLKMNLDSTFTTLIRNQGKELEIASKFKEFTKSKIEPSIDIETGIITFTWATGDDRSVEKIKISKGEESIFIFSVFLVLLESIISELNEDIENRTTDEFNFIEYIYVDDPVTSLDDNYTIDIAIALKNIMRKSNFDSRSDLKFIISSHHALFYNVLYNELNKKNAFVMLKKDDRYVLKQKNDSPFGYHLNVKEEIEYALKEEKVQKYHFTLFRNLLEKTATYLGYSHWYDLVGNSMFTMTDDERQGYIRLISLYSHNTHSEMDSREVLPHEQATLKLLFTNFIENYKWKMEDQDGN